MAGSGGGDHLIGANGANSGGAVSGERPKLRHIASHTGLRGVAALLVVLYHFQFDRSYRFAFETGTALFDRGYLWVDLFFILSGFIISYTSDAERIRPFTTEQGRRFLIARLARIYPLHLFCLVYLGLFVAAISLAFLLLGRPAPISEWSGDGAVQFIAQLLLIHAWLPMEPHWNIPSWSISAELFAYLMFPLIVSLHSRARAATKALLLIVPLLFYSYIASTTGVLDIVMLLAPWRCLAGFSLGMLIYFHRRKIDDVPDAMLSVLQAGAAAAVIALLMVRVNDVLLIPAFVVLVAATWPDRGVIARLLGLRPFQFLGEISYSVYLNHVCLFAIFGFFWGRIAPRLDMIDPAVLRAFQLAVRLALVLIVSRWTFRHIEAPARLYLSRHLLGRTPRVPAEVPVAP